MKLFTSILTFAIFFIVSHNAVYGQKTEINLNAYSGLFFFSGDGATNNSTLVLFNYSDPSTYTENPYGKKSKFSYSLEAEIKQLTKNNNFYGAAIGFERLTSKVHIDTTYVNGIIYQIRPANGTTSLRNSYINFSPFFGHRFKFNKINIDVLAGMDLAFCVESRETADLFQFKNKLNKPTVDFRPRMQIKLQKNKIGFLLGYSHGLTNYQKQNNEKAFTNYLKAGFSYKIR